MYSDQENPLKQEDQKYLRMQERYFNESVKKIPVTVWL